MPKIVSMTVIPIAFFVFLVQADFKRAAAIGSYPLLMIAGILSVYALSVAVWIYNIEETAYIIAGTERIIFQIINICVVFSAVYIFGSRAVDYTLIGACIMNIIRLAQGVMVYGVSQSVSDFIYALRTGIQTGFMAAAEIQTVTYVFGLFLLYYLFASDYPLKKKAVYIGACVFFILTGFKRIIFASVIASVLAGFVGFKLKPRHREVYCMVLGIVTAVFSLFYIYAIRSGIFEYVMNSLDIETNMRIEIYNYMADTYVFSPSYVGRGIDYVVRYLEYLKTLGVSYGGSSLLYIHNDILVRFIEMGFVGFCGWLYACCIFSQKWMYKKFGISCAFLYCLANLYSFINYSVGNTNRAYAVRMSLAMVIVGAISLYAAEKKKNTDIKQRGSGAYDKI